MNGENLASSVAAEFGEDVVLALTQNSTRPRSATGLLADAAAMASFIVQCIELTCQVRQLTLDRPEQSVDILVRDELFTNKSDGSDEERRLQVLALILTKQYPDIFQDISNQIGNEAKSAWVRKLNDQHSETTIDGVATRRPTGGPLILQPFAEQHWWIVFDDIGWEPDTTSEGLPTFIVPRGFVTDLASVPRYLWPIFNKTGLYGLAAIYHDWLYWQQDVARSVADDVFREAMQDMGVDPVSRSLIWSGVRLFGGRYWTSNTAVKKAGERRILRRFPQTPTIKWVDWKAKPDVFA